MVGLGRAMLTGHMPTGAEFRAAALAFERTAADLYRAASVAERIADRRVFDGVMQTTAVEHLTVAMVAATRSAAAECERLAFTGRVRAALADDWAREYHRYERATATWRRNVERSGVGARPQPPERPVPWMHR